MVTAPVVAPPTQIARGGVFIGGFKTRFDLLLPNMVDIDVILGMEWLSLYHAILDCHAKMVTLAMPGSPQLEWKAFVRDVSVDTPTVESVTVVRDYPDVFPADFPGMLPDRDIDSGIELSMGTQSISIPSYRMTPAKLKELKDQLQDLLDKGFIRLALDKH
ncbi:uncharacterized protein [Nicotiana tomentosiformis]|uniref:uncharacterized protein n=1 Tax=Nicotiana tomentosiformis TaxID=4098 RepID=UPI00388C9C87